MSGLKQIVLASCLLFTAGSSQAQNWVPHSTSDNTTVVQRHETGSVTSGSKLYVLGGRGNRPVQVFDASANKWSTLAPLPMEMHHFQPVVLNGYIYVIGAFTCCYPAEQNIADIYRLNLASNTWETHGTMPADRVRGSTGAVAHNNKIYIIGGNTNGHSGGAVDWFDEYDPATGNWRVLPDAPNSRDHFSAAMVGNKLVAASGRRSNLSFGGMVAATDVYNFNTNTWLSAPAIPTPRAGAMIGIKNGSVVVMGGETDTQLEAHDEVEAYHVGDNEWRALPSLEQGRHGGAGGVTGNTLHAITGNLYRGGGQETTVHEKLDVADANNDGVFDFEVSDDTGGTDNTGTDNSGGTDSGSTDGSGGNTDGGTNPSNPTDNPDPTLDSDNDGLTDTEESALQTNAQDRDSDGDSLSDGDEVNIHNTNPLSQDTDSDGLNDAEEISISSNPLDADSDADGLSDIDELQTYGTNPINNDSDGDTLTDKDELQLHFTDPLLADSDNDGLDDNAEVNTYNSNPNAWDTDGDGVSDATEAAESTDLVNNDQDGDGILNSAEGTGDTDGDTVPNYQDLDSDNDGIPDLRENGNPDENLDGLLDNPAITELADAMLDADQDGIANAYDLDSDQDGATDLLEAGHADPFSSGRVAMADFTDTNQNGWHDALEGLALPDTDADTTPDFLDLDSNDDGQTDIADGGIDDIDDDGKVDNFSDINGDGFHDELEGLERNTQDSEGQDTDSEGVTEPGNNEPGDGDEDSSQAKSNSGCSISGYGGSTDPLLLLLLLASFIAVVRPRRFRKPHQGRL